MSKSQWKLSKPFIIKDNDERFEEYSKILDITGISPDELWNLDSVFAAFILPRLILYRENSNGYPYCLGSQEKWNKKLDKMIVAFELIIKQHETEEIEEDNKKIKKGLKLFSKWFRCLWT